MNADAIAIKCTMKELGLSKSDVAKHIGISTNKLGRLLNSNLPFEMCILLQLAVSNTYEEEKQKRIRLRIKEKSFQSAQANGG